MLYSSHLKSKWKCKQPIIAFSRAEGEVPTSSEANILAPSLIEVCLLTPGQAPFNSPKKVIRKSIPSFHLCPHLCLYLSTNTRRKHPVTPLFKRRCQGQRGGIISVLTTDSKNTQQPEDRPEGPPFKRIHGDVNFTIR